MAETPGLNARPGRITPHWHKTYPRAPYCPFSFNECVCHIRHIEELEEHVADLRIEGEAAQGEIGHLRAQLKQEDD
jgi:hypothetical protein